MMRMSETAEIPAVRVDKSVSAVCAFFIAPKMMDTFWRKYSLAAYSLAIKCQDDPLVSRSSFLILLSPANLFTLPPLLVLMAFFLLPFPT